MSEKGRRRAERAKVGQRLYTPGIKELAQREQWVRWKLTYREGKWTKVPYRANGTARAKSTDPSTWATFDAVLAGHGDGLLDDKGGIGFVFADGGNLVGFDFDGCREPTSGRISQWGQSLIDSARSYTEVSPSNTGVKLWVKGVWPDEHGRKEDLVEAERLTSKQPAIEAYDRARYFTVTGRHLDDTPETIEPNQAFIDAVYLRYFAANGIPRGSGERRDGDTSTDFDVSDIPASPGLQDEEILAFLKADERYAERFEKLFNQGDISDYDGNDSSADLALVGDLLRFTGDDVEQLDRLFRRSALSREKWTERPGYRRLTIHRANQDLGWRYTPPGDRANGHATSQDIPGAAEPEPEDLLPLDEQALRTLNDTGNGERLIERYGRDLHYVPENKKWLAWDGTRWVTDLGTRVQGRAKATMRGLLKWATKKLDSKTLSDDARDKLKAVQSHARKSLAAPRIGGMINMAQSEPGVVVSNNDLDVDIWLFNVANGTLDLRTGELHKHRREDLISRRSDVVYDPNADCPRWKRFLLEVFEGNQAMIDYIQRGVGLSLTGYTMSRALFLLHGFGRNGKSTFLDVLHALYGEYAASVSAETLMRKSQVGSGIPNDIASLRGARFVSAIETDEGRGLAEALIKSMTGGTDPLPARFLYGEWFRFQPQFKLWLATNHLPEITGSGSAMWDRIHRIDFNVRFVGENDDPDDEDSPRRANALPEDKQLPETLRGELSGILNWALEGLRMYQEAGGLLPPPEVIKATTEYRREADHFLRFIHDRCERSPTREERFSDLYLQYSIWCSREDMKPVGTIRFSRRLKELGLTSRQSNGPIWEGIGLKPVVW